MKIDSISVYQMDIPMRASTISHGRVTECLDTTVVRIETDTGLVGWGDSVPWGANFVAAYPHGARAGLDELAPHLLGKDPRMVGEIDQLMDKVMTGHPYVKVSLDMACWDILGKSLNAPLYMLLGGKLTEAPIAIGSIPHIINDKLLETVDTLRSVGCTYFSAKASGDTGQDIAYLRGMAEIMRAGESIKFDVNGGWRVDQAIRVARGMGDTDVFFEAPCATYEECREVRRTTGVPLVLDETALTLHDVLRAKEDGVLDALNLKMGRVGGISKMRVIRDVCVALNVPIEVQDSSYSHISCAAVAHIANSTPERCVSSVAYPKGLMRETLEYGPKTVDGRVITSDAPGLGIQPIASVLGEPIRIFRE